MNGSGRRKARRLPNPPGLLLTDVIGSVGPDRGAD